MYGWPEPYLRCIYGIFGSKKKICMVIYGVCMVLANPTSECVCTNVCILVHTVALFDCVRLCWCFGVVVLGCVCFGNTVVDFAVSSIGLNGCVCVCVCVCVRAAQSVLLV